MFIHENASENMVCEMTAILSRGGGGGGGGGGGDELKYRIPMPQQNDRKFADDILKFIFFNKNFWILYKVYWNRTTRVQLTIRQH